MLKERVVSETIRLFLLHGIDFKLSDIANNLSISKKTIYRYFKSKEELLMKSVDSLFLSIHKEQNRIFNDTSIDELERLKKLMIAMPIEVETLNLSFLVDIQKEYPEVYKRIQHYLESDWEQTFSLIDSCKSKGLIKDIDNNIIRAMFLGSEEKIVELSSLNLDYEKIQEQMIDILIGGIKNA